MSSRDVKFRDGQQIVCVNNTRDNNDYVVDLTYGKIYRVYEDSIMDYSSGVEIVFIQNDAGYLINYSAYRFISVEEYRSRVITGILN